MCDAKFWVASLGVNSKNNSQFVCFFMLKMLIKAWYVLRLHLVKKIIGNEKK